MTRPEDRAEAPSPVLAVSITAPTRLTDVQEWAAACDLLGMPSDGVAIEINGLHDRLTASIDLDSIDSLVER